MEVADAGTNLWEALTGRSLGRPLGPDDTDLWQAIVDRLNPAKARPRLRDGIEEVELTSIRGGRYVMLRSPDAGESSYLRLSPDEVTLAHRMDGTRTVAALVGEFTTISGRLAPDQVVRVVADLAGNRMLDELPVDAFEPLSAPRLRKRPLPVRIGRGLLAAARGQRMVLADIDRAAGWLYRAGGRFLFTRPAAVLMALVALAGLALFGWTWVGGAESVFLTGGSYATGALVLLGLNLLALSCHELGHALAAKHAGRRVPAMGVLLYFGLPSAFVDTTDVWMAGRKARLLTSAAGPVAAVTLAGAAQLVALAVPEFAPIAFKLAFVWYLNSLFNLNPLLALDGYYLFMDWLEIPNLRPRAMVTLIGWVRHRRPRWSDLDREGRMIAIYAILAALWLVVMLNLLVRMYRDRVGGLVVGMWHAGMLARLIVIVVAVALVSPLVHAVVAAIGRLRHRARDRRRERDRVADLPNRVAALRGTALRTLPEAGLLALAEPARWTRPQRGRQVLAADASPGDVLLVDEGLLEGRRPGDPPGTIRARAGVGELVGADETLAGSPSALAWTAVGTRLLAIPVQVFAAVVGPFAREAAAGVVDGGPRAGMHGMAPGAGVHPSGGYPPLTPRPGPPTAGDDDRDRRLMRAMVILLIVLLLLAMMSGRAVRLDAMTWTEMPDDRVLLTVEEGHVDVVLAGQHVRLNRGDRRFLTQSDLVEVARRSYAVLTFRGGAEAILCARTDVTVGRLHTVPAPATSGPFWLRIGTRAPVGNLDLRRGGVLADTDSPSPRFRPLRLAMDAGTSRVETVQPADQPVGQPADAPDAGGAAAFVVLTGGGAALVSATSGTVHLDGDPVPVTDDPIGCPHGPDAATTGRGAPVSPDPQAAPSPTEPGPAATGPSPTGEPTAAPTDPAETSTLDPTEQPTGGPTDPPDPTGTPTEPPGPDPTPDPTDPTQDPTDPTPDPTEDPTEDPTLEPTDPPDTAPTIVVAAARPNRIAQVGAGCGPEPNQTTIVARITDDEDDPGDLAVWFTYRLDTAPAIAGTVAMPYSGSGDDFSGTLGPFEAGDDIPRSGGTFAVIVHVRDSAGNVTTSGPIDVVLTACAVPQ